MQELQLTKGVLLLLVFCWEQECSYIPSWFGTRYVGQADLEIVVLLPLPPSHVVRFKCVQVNSDFISNPKTSFHTSFIALTFLVHSSLILVKCLRWPLVTFPNAHDLLLLNKLQLSKLRVFIWNLKSLQYNAIPLFRQTPSPLFENGWVYITVNEIPLMVPLPSKNTGVFHTI